MKKQKAKLVDYSLLMWSFTFTPIEGFNLNLRIPVNFYVVPQKGVRVCCV